MRLGRRVFDVRSRSLFETLRGPLQMKKHSTAAEITCHSNCSVRHESMGEGGLREEMDKGNTFAGVEEEK